MKDFITAVGLMMILEGVPYFIAPERMRLWILKVAQMDERSLRHTGFALMFLGLVVVYLVRTRL